MIDRIRASIGLTLVASQRDRTCLPFNFLGPFQAPDTDAPVRSACTTLSISFLVIELIARSPSMSTMGRRLATYAAMVVSRIRCPDSQSSTACLTVRGAERFSPPPLRSSDMTSVCHSTAAARVLNLRFCWYRVPSGRLACVRTSYRGPDLVCTVTAHFGGLAIACSVTRRCGEGRSLNPRAQNLVVPVRARVCGMRGRRQLVIWSARDAGGRPCCLSDPKNHWEICWFGVSASRHASPARWKAWGALRVCLKLQLVHSRWTLSAIHSTALAF